MKLAHFVLKGQKFTDSLINFIRISHSVGRKKKVLRITNWKVVCVLMSYFSPQHLSHLNKLSFSKDMLPQ